MFFFNPLTDNKKFIRDQKRMRFSPIFWRDSIALYDEQIGWLLFI